MSHKEITWNNLQIPVVGSFDVVIIGGGVSGSACGIRCVNEGLSTLIVDKSNLLGGSATRALVCPMMPSYVRHLPVLSAIEQQLLASGDATRDDYTTMIWFAPERLGEVYEQLYTTKGGQILYDTSLVAAVLTDADDEKTITHVILVSTEGLIAVAAQTWIDASGDAVLSRAAGVLVAAGDEDGVNQVCSLRFTMGGIDVERYRDYVLSLDDHFSPLVEGYFFESAMVAGRNFKLEPKFREGIEAGILEEEDLRYYQIFSLPGKPGCMALNCPHIASMRKNTSGAARSNATVEAHARIRRLVTFLQRMMPGFEQSYLMEQASLLGVRESWRVEGQTMLTEEDYVNQARFDDGLVRGDWYIDVHSNKGGLFHKNTYEQGDYYEIPFRSMVTKHINNLGVIGRCISTTFLMQASVRIIPTVTDMGDAMGTACALAKQTSTPLAQLDGVAVRAEVEQMKPVNS